MSRLKWFSGGIERRDEAISILELLIQDLKDENHLDSLHSLLISYYNELKNGAGSVPYILSRLNIEISHVLIEEGLHLSEEQSNKITKLRKLSNIRYGY